MVSLIGFGFVAIGIFFFIMGRRASHEGRRQRSWPSVGGTVTSAVSTLPHGRPETSNGPGYVPKVTYDYTVGGNPYTASRIGVVPSQGYTRTRVEQILAQYKPGSSVTVHYDPAEPGTATLKPAAKGGGIIVALGVVFIIVGLPVLLAGLSL